MVELSLTNFEKFGFWFIFIQAKYSP